ncbi:MAG TPA: carboxypeptidase regulatory-like domain-containing protein [Xanthobacteraceae bacterium]|nr:carboxypeptidase regulatory-like domain-containing protein [Xanthobacteraceae bacterium]
MRARLIAAVFAACMLHFPGGAIAQSTDALAGQVSSDREGAMEGVVVSAKKAGSIVTVSVVSDDKGHYRFPADRLEPGAYTLTIRAIGYDLDGKATAQVEAAKTAMVDLKLKPTRNLPAQLSNAEWLASFPGADRQKKALLNCIGCHDLDRIARSTHDADEFVQVFDRMTGYYPGSTPEYPQRLIGDARRSLGQGPGMRAIAEYLASVNLSKDETWSYPLKTLARPKGRATHVIVTEYDLPRKQIQPHDVILDAQGQVWFTEFGEQFLGRFDPRTLRVTEYPLPVIKPGFPIGTLDLEMEKSGKLWISMMYQAGVARFDPKTERFETWSVPKEWQTDATQQAFVTPVASDVDGKVWVKNSDRAQILRLDPATGKWENFGSFEDPATKKRITSYGIPADAENNLYLLDFSSSDIGRLDAKTLELTVFKGEIANSRPRRGRFDAQDHLWFAEYGGNAVGRLDPKSGQVQEWQLPTPWAEPYDVVTDKNGEAWTGSMLSDRVSRLDPKTGDFVEYLLPRRTNIRRVFVDNSTTPVSFWTGNNHGAAIVRVEPLD